MSLQVDGIWKGGVWAATVWLAGVWFENSTAPVLSSPALDPLPHFDVELVAKKRKRPDYTLLLLG